ncbi:hypothetical protein GOP47_0024402 [Adiantum capillus-veneris]|nr:hypothetical protein GOP47_0024402 [Adiantum capillus-veneris]
MTTCTHLQQQQHQQQLHSYLQHQQLQAGEVCTRARHLHPQGHERSHRQQDCLLHVASTIALTEEEERASAPPSPAPLVVVSFYKFAHLPDYQSKRQPLKDLCEELRVSGGIILASEGINGSICGTRNAVEKVLKHIESDERLMKLRRTESPATDEEEELHHGHTEKSPLGAGDDAPFRWGHVRVKLKNEIVTLGIPEVSPAKEVGKYVSPKEWNSLLQEDGTMIIDVRNSYEIRIGKFKGAVDPETESFREFPAWIDDHLRKQESTSQSDGLNAEVRPNYPRKVAMYCTGGIRCEKATSLLMSKGFKEVYHLEGGILNYLEEIPASESLWEGECFVFDKRVSVEHGLKVGTHKLCYACKKPVNDEDMLSPAWEDGVSCPYCIHVKSEKEKERARARQRQYEHWGLVGGPHKGKRPWTPDDSFQETRNSDLTELV